jgi:hypothetical protein
MAAVIVRSGGSRTRSFFFLHEFIENQTEDEVLFGGMNLTEAVMPRSIENPTRQPWKSVKQRLVIFLG